MDRPGTANGVSIAFIGLGANLGDRAGTLAAAVAALGSAAGVEIRRRSSFYESAPVGVLDQPWFLNGVIEVATTLKWTYRYSRKPTWPTQFSTRSFGCASRERLRPGGRRAGGA